MSQPLTETDIIFPHLSNTPSLSNTLSSLRRSTLSIHNRLSSISSDSAFVASVAEVYSLPLVANERCGSWYIPLKKKAEGVYFKSTDGHMGEWGFSLRRLNLQLLDVVGKWGGAVIVDSTRRGKSMPDALSKTVPIWCCVINRAIFGSAGQKYELYTPPQAVSESEHAQIERRIDGFVRQFLEICKPNIPNLRTKLRKPLRPIWVTQESSLPDATPSFPDFHAIVLCTASRRVRGAEISEAGYIQGAADDHEAWSHGLTPTLFWKHKDQLMKTSEDDAPGLIAKLLKEEKGTSAVPTWIEPTSNLHISSSENADLTGFDVVISCTLEPLAAATIKNMKGKHYLHLKCQTGKLGSRDLRTRLSRIDYFFSSLSSPPSGKFLICCPTGKDLSVGTALAVLCLYADDEGKISPGKRREARDINKNFIKQRLSWITTSNPALNPSRATLQSVNAVLLASQDPKAFLQKKEDFETTLESRCNPNTRETKPVPQELATEQQHQQEQRDPLEPPDMPSAIFSHLQTSPNIPWRFTRTLYSSLSTHPSGTVTGTATLTPCTLHPLSTPTLLYAEEGEFVTDTGLRFTARRKYVYQLQNEDQEEGRGRHIAVHFFDDEKMPLSTIVDGVGERGQGIGGLFVEMDSLSPHDEVLEAKNKEQHLCAEDLYSASWKFSNTMTGAAIEGTGKAWWEVRYDVKGPRKDYVSSTRYTRD